MTNKDKQFPPETVEIVLGALSSILYGAQEKGLDRIDLIAQTSTALVEMNRRNLINGTQKIQASNYLFHALRTMQGEINDYILLDTNTGLYSLRPKWRQKLAQSKAQEHQSTTALSS